MQNITTRTIREIAIESPATTRIFESHHIDYCCGGRVNFMDACRKAGVDADIVKRDLEAVLVDKSSVEPDFSARTLSELIDHILDSHHRFTYDELDRLQPLMDKVNKVHGDVHPELAKMSDLLDAMHSDLLPHMYKEEQILFPYIKDLEYAKLNGLTPRFPPFGTVQHPIRMMMGEHDAVGDMLKEMRAVSGGFAVPVGACPSYQGLLTRLEELERDLHQHIHLENNVLFPRAAVLEAEAFGSH
ncbi:MAG: iron-sulfur cluster repair di-iron protein [Pyrinomonadaceae bacterium]|nr:iron-sulfur cluster repair di-iron protein [Pyrinomonadaceae bacterium]